MTIALAVLPFSNVRGAIGVYPSALSVSLAVLPRAGVRAAIGRRLGALAVGLAFAISLAGVLHATGSSRFGVASKRFRWRTAPMAQSATGIKMKSSGHPHRIL